MKLNNNKEKLSLTVSSEDSQQRLDRYLATVEGIETRNRAAHLIDSDLVLVNGKVAKASYKVNAQDRIEINLPEPESSDLTPLDMKLDILYEDSDIIVVNKPAGLVVHPAAGHAQDTLVNALLHHTQDLSMKFGEKRPGIVHRLDKDTSGILVIAKNDRAHEVLAQKFKNRDIHRIYFAVVVGKPPHDSGRSESFLARHSTDRKRFASVRDKSKKIITSANDAPAVGKWAVTEYKTLQQVHGLSYMQLKLQTGRTHQIRVHLSEMGTPILGDQLYGADKKIKNLKDSVFKTVKNLPRFTLHAAELGFRHPTTQQELFFKVDWPESEKRLLQELGFTL